MVLGITQEDTTLPKAPPALDPAGRRSQWSRRSSGETPFERPARFEFFEPIERKVLVRRHFEELLNAETVQVLSLEKTAAGNRYICALRRLKGALGCSADLLGA